MLVLVDDYLRTWVFIFKHKFDAFVIKLARDLIDVESSKTIKHMHINSNMEFF